jgi:uroporphyrinogen-III synthase
MKLILTRPEPDSRKLAAKLAELGHESAIIPLLKIVARQTPAIPKRNWQAICFTSANGIMARPHDNSILETKVLTVGPQSFAAARLAGFTKASAHGGDVDGLVQHITSTMLPTGGPILYPSGAETSGDLEGKLKARGFDVARVIVYDAVPTQPTGLDAVIAAAHGVLLFSPRTAMLWRDTQANMSALTHYCLSPAVAAKLPKHLDQRVASTPDEPGMLALLAKLEPKREAE